MHAISVARRSRKFRFYLLLAVVTTAFYGLYFEFLKHEERVMERRYAELRGSDPDLYLSKLRQSEGFKVYLGEFRALKGYNAPKSEVPPFIMGRWALFDHEKRVDDAYVPPDCVDNVEIEDAHLRFAADGGRLYDVRYVLEGGMVKATRADGGPILVRPVAYGAHMHHIELTLPGGGGRRFGYLCK